MQRSCEAKTARRSFGSTRQRSIDLLLIQEQLIRSKGEAKDWESTLQLGALTHLAYNVPKKHSARAMAEFK